MVRATHRYPAGIDYDETFAPVTRYDPLRLIVALAAQFSLQLRQADIKGPFLNGDLEENIYMLAPPGIDLDGKYLKITKGFIRTKARTVEVV